MHVFSGQALVLLLPLLVAVIALLGYVLWMVFISLINSYNQIRHPDFAAPANPRVARVLTIERTRMSFSLLVGVTFSLVAMGPLLELLGVGVDDTSPASFPDLLAMFPWYGLGAGFAGLLVYLLWPPTRRTARGGTRQADLEERTPSRFSPAWALYVPLTTAGALVTALFVAGFASTQDAEGHWRRLEVPIAESAILDDEGIVTQVLYEIRSINFPGWYYSVPLMIGIATLIILTYLALLRIAKEPRIPTASSELDAAVRAKQSRFVMAASGASFAAAIGQFLTACAQPLMYSTLQRGFKIGNKVGTEGLEHMEYTHSQPWTGIGSALQVIAYVAAILTIWLLLVAIRSANSLGKLR